MEQTVRVMTCNSDGTATVLHIRESACSGDCHKCTGCGAAQQKMFLTVNNPIGAKPGQDVIIQSSSRVVLVAAAVFYLLPVLMFFIGYTIGLNLWNTGWQLSLAFVAISVAICFFFDRFFMKKQKIVYTISGLVKKKHESYDKGDNDLD